VLEPCMAVEQVDSELEQVGTVPAACMAAELVAAMVPPAVAMPAHVESPLGRSAQLVGSAVVVEDLARVPCHTWELARESTYRRRRSSMLGLEAISTLFDREEISPASSRAAVV